MVIAFDARAYSWAGIGRYTRNLLRFLVKSSSPHRFIALVSRRDRAASASLAALASHAPPGRLTTHLVDSSYYSWREQTLFLLQLMRVKADLFHFTHFNLPLLFRRPYVVTIHDTTRFIFPGQVTRRLSRQVVHEYVFQSAVEHARTVVCVSRFTCEELRRLPLSVPSHAIISEGVDEIFLKPVSQDARRRARALLGTSDPFVLFVGVWMAHKNLHRLLGAFRILQRKHVSLRLVITGTPRPGYAALAPMVSALNLGDRVIFPGFVPHDLLPALYAEARCLALPSLYEGFGLPPLEAAACGTPSVVSSVSAFPEVMGDAAEYVNPEYTDGIARALMRLVADERRRAVLIARARQRAQRFLWEHIAHDYLSVYERAH